MGRLTSKFSYHRRHPITGKIQPHLGIDLAAPTGTPIMAAGDGRIISIGRNGGNGKQIIIAHSGGYRTYYGHMSRYKTGLHRGSKIHKKDIIGYVGSTGIATGPHLDYRIRHNGVFKNPFSITFKPKLILSKKDIVDFSRQVQSLALLMKGQNTVDHQIIKVSSVTLFDQEKNNITLL
jgi:murein DD-endopeptidase MepM/ murein hydrolase activator NlpD